LVNSETGLEIVPPQIPGEMSKHNKQLLPTTNYACRKQRPSPEVADNKEADAPVVILHQNLEVKKNPVKEENTTTKTTYQ